MMRSSYKNPCNPYKYLFATCKYEMRRSRCDLEVESREVGGASQLRHFVAPRLKVGVADNLSSETFLFHHLSLSKHRYSLLSITARVYSLFLSLVQSISEPIITLSFSEISLSSLKGPSCIKVL